MANLIMEDGLWMDKWRFEEAEKQFQLLKSGVAKQCSESSLVSEIAKAREHIKKSLVNEAPATSAGAAAGAAGDSSVMSRLECVEAENKSLKQVTADLQAVVKRLESRIAALEKGSVAPAPENAAAVNKPEKEAESEEDDFELFGSDEEDDEAAEKIKAERVKLYQEKKKDKKVIIAKSNVILDVKPWDDETDMEAMEKSVRAIKMDGLLWGASKFVPLAYGIKKLQISCVVEDDKVSIEELEELIQGFEDQVQSTDIAAFNKL